MHVEMSETFRLHGLQIHAAAHSLCHISARRKIKDSGDKIILRLLENMFDGGCSSSPLT